MTKYELLAKSLRRDAIDYRDGLFAVGTDKTMDNAADCIEQLQAELQASQRRERAAVEDLKRHRKHKCDACRFSGGVTAYSPCRDCQSPISNFGDGWEWRGQEQEGDEQK